MLAKLLILLTLFAPIIFLVSCVSARQIKLLNSTEFGIAMQFRDDLEKMDLKNSSSKLGGGNVYVDEERGLIFLSSVDDKVFITIPLNQHPNHKIGSMNYHVKLFKTEGDKNVPICAAVYIVDIYESGYESVTLVSKEILHKDE